MKSMLQEQSDSECRKGGPASSASAAYYLILRGALISFGIIVRREKEACAWWYRTSYKRDGKHLEHYCCDSSKMLTV